MLVLVSDRWHCSEALFNSPLIPCASSLPCRIGLASGWRKIQTIRFNQDGSNFVVGTEEGFRIYMTNPLQ